VYYKNENFCNNSLTDMQYCLVLYYRVTKKFQKDIISYNYGRKYSQYQTFELWLYNLGNIETLGWHFIVQ